MLAGDTPLIDASRFGRAADVAALLAGGADVNEPRTDDSRATALHIACLLGHTKVVTTAPTSTPWFKRLPNDFPIQFEVWEVFVMPHMVTRDYQPPPPPPPPPPRRSARVAGRG